MQCVFNVSTDRRIYYGKIFRTIFLYTCNNRKTNVKVRSVLHWVFYREGYINIYDTLHKMCPCWKRNFFPCIPNRPSQSYVLYFHDILYAKCVMSWDYTELFRDQYFIRENHVRNFSLYGFKLRYINAQYTKYQCTSYCEKKISISLKNDYWIANVDRFIFTVFWFLTLSWTRAWFSTSAFRIEVVLEADDRICLGVENTRSDAATKRAKEKEEGGERGKER